jgi:NDP-sugar pyrophosphorylase family protein
MQCVVLAGGLGTRMRPLTDQIPKALISVCGRPFVDHQLRHLADQGVRRVVLSVGYRGGLVRDFVGDGSRWGLSVAYVDEGDELRGTGGALRLALDEGALAESFMVLYGDSYLPISLGPIRAAFRATSLPALMVVLRNTNRWEASNARFAEGRVIEYDKRRAGESGLDWIDYGVSVLSGTVVEGEIAPGEVSDLADVYSALSQRGLLAGFPVSQRFYEIGSPAGLRELERYLCA